MTQKKLAQPDVIDWTWVERSSRKHCRLPIELPMLPAVTELVLSSEQFIIRRDIMASPQVIQAIIRAGRPQFRYCRGSLRVGSCCTCVHLPNGSC